MAKKFGEIGNAIDVFNDIANELFKIQNKKKQQNFC